jgi:hypothetical protein
VVSVAERHRPAQYQAVAQPVRQGGAAAFAGVTVKTVRHYHRQGLIEEARRDASGNRRHRSADLLRLIQVRTLAAGGVPASALGRHRNRGPDSD